ncbi:MAG: hydrogenase maturation protease [Bacteroidales bacterium]
MKSILILGIGNMILRDEGVGIHVVHKLEQTETFPEDVDVVDGATGGYFLLNDVIEYKHVILIDATLDNLPPGTVRVIRPRYSTDYPPLMSAHEFGLKNMIDAMIFLEKMPDMHLIVVSVAEVQRMSLSLSPAVEAAIPEVIRNVKNIVQQLRSDDYDQELTVASHPMGEGGVTGSF